MARTPPQSAAAAENQRLVRRHKVKPNRKTKPPRPAKPERRAAPKFTPVPTPDQSQGRPSEPVKVVVRKPTGKPRPDGTKRVKREVHTLPNAAAAQAHLDRLEQAREQRARARGQRGDTGRSARPKVVIIPREGQSFEDAQKGAAREQRRYERRIAAADAVVRLRVRARARRQRRQDERDVGLVGQSRGSRTSTRRFSRAVEREARKAAPEVVAAVKNLSGRERDEFHGEAVKHPAARDQLKREADKRERVRKAAEPKPGDVLGNAKREVVDTLTGLPASVAEAAKVAAEQLDTSGRVDKPHTKAFVEGLKRSAVGELARGHVKKAATTAATHPVSTVLTVAGGVGQAAKGVSVAADAARVVKAGERAPAKVRVAVRRAQAARRVRENATVDTQRRSSTREATRRERTELQGGAAQHRRGDVATRARFYHANPVVRAGQKLVEDVKAARGKDPHQKRGRAAKRIVKRDAGRRVDVVQAAGHVRQHEVDAAVDDALARERGPKGAARRAKVRRVEKRAVRGGGRLGEKGERRHALALVQSGIAHDRDTLEQHIEVHRRALESGTVKGERLTDDERRAVRANLDRLERIRDAGHIEDPDIHAAAGQRRKVTEGQERRRAPRLEGGRERMRGRDEKVIREARAPVPSKQEPGAPSTLGASETPGPAASRAGGGPDNGRGAGAEKSLRFKTPSHELERTVAAIRHTIGRIDDDLANLPLRRKRAIRDRARGDADRKAILDRYERARYALEQKRARLEGKAANLEARLKTRQERLRAQGAVERTVHGVRVEHHPDSPEAAELRDLAGKRLKHRRREALLKRRDDVTTEISRVERARMNRVAEDPAGELRAAYQREHGVSLPRGDAHALRRERDRLSGLAAEKPNKILAARIRKIERIIKVEHDHHSMQRRRQGRVGHRRDELADVERELARLDRELGEHTADSIEKRIVELRHRPAAPPAKATRLTVRQIQRERLSREIDDEHRGVALHGERPRPTADLEADRAALRNDSQAPAPPAGEGRGRTGTRDSSPQPRGEGSFVPTTRELQGEPDPRLGVSPIRGRWSKKDMLTEDWSKYDPAAVQGRLERGISAAELRREVLRSSKADGLTFERADAEVARLNRDSGVKWGAVETTDGRYAVVPKAIADRWTAATRRRGLFGRSLQTVNQRFVRAVLPLSATWHAGNAADMMTRLALTGARPGDAALAHELRRQLADVDEEWARLAVDSVGGAHFRGQSTRDAPIARHIPVVDDALDQLFALGRAFEAKAARSAQGSALRAQAKALGEEARDVQALVRQWRKRPELVEDFQARTLEIIGDYVHHPLLGSRDLRQVAPFIQWVKASLRFTFATLPARHPVRTALMFQLAQATEKQRRLIGASQYITKEQARALGLPAPRSGFLGGGVALADGAVVPTSNLTSFGSAAGLVEDPLQWAGQILVPWADKPAARVAGTRDGLQEYAGRTVVRAVEGKKNPTAPGSGRDTGKPGSARSLGEAASGLAEALVPGVGVVAKVRRGGRRPGVHTTAIASIRHGSAKTKDGRFKDGSTGRTHGPIQTVLGFTPQRDFPTRPVGPETSGPAGVIVTVRAVDGSTYRLDTRTGRVVP